MPGNILKVRELGFRVMKLGAALSLVESPEVADDLAELIRQLSPALDQELDGFDIDWLSQPSETSDLLDRRGELSLRRMVQDGLIDDGPGEFWAIRRKFR